MMRRRARASLFPVNVWPPFVDAVVLVLAAFALVTLVALVAQRALISRLSDRDAELARMREEKARIERRLRALAPGGVIDVDDGKVILQGEVLFDSGSDELRPEGRRIMEDVGKGLVGLLDAEPGQMVLVGGHTDDKPLVDRGGARRFASNWELSTARALAVTRVLVAAGVPPARVFASGFGEFHPRAPNADDASRRKNRRIEVLLVPVQAVASR